MLLAQAAADAVTGLRRGIAFARHGRAGKEHYNALEFLDQVLFVGHGCGGLKIGRGFGSRKRLRVASAGFDLAYLSLRLT